MILITSINGALQELHITCILIINRYGYLFYFGLAFEQNSGPKDFKDALIIKIRRKIPPLVNLSDANELQDILLINGW